MGEGSPPASERVGIISTAKWQNRNRRERMYASFRRDGFRRTKNARTRPVGMTSVRKFCCRRSCILLVYLLGCKVTWVKYLSATFTRFFLKYGPGRCSVLWFSLTYLYPKHERTRREYRVRLINRERYTNGRYVKSYDKRGQNYLSVTSFD